MTNGSKNYGPGDWFQYWPVDMSAYTGDSAISFTCKGQQTGAHSGFSVAIGPLTLVGPAGVRVVDNFTYSKQMPKDPWGEGSSWLTEWPGSSTQPWLKIQCSNDPAKPLTVVRPAAATPSVDYVFQAYDYTHLSHEYIVDDDFIVNNTQGTTASGGGYATSMYLDAGIPLSS